jgi:phosphoglycolate phosphatase
MKKYQLYIFDWDGTIMDTTATIVEATQYACRELSLAEVSSQAAKSIIGQSFFEVISSIVPELHNNPHLLQRYTSLYVDYLNQHSLANPFFPYVNEILAKLTQYNKTLAVATGRSRVMLDEILSATDSGKYFILTKTACECASKPHPQMIEEILDFTGIAKEDTVMIGDTTHDIEMAHNAGVDVIALAQGAHDYDLLASAKPDYLLNDIAQLYTILEQYGY